MSEKFNMTAKTFFGLEEILAEELKQLGADDIEILTRAVSFRGNKELMYKANLYCRTALRILKPVHKFRVRNEKDLYKRTKDKDWSEFLTNDMTFAVDSAVYSEHFNHENYVALKVKDAIVDQFRARTGKRPSVNTIEPDLRINVHISREDCMISLDSSGYSLHKRGWRDAQDKAPINEVLAAGMIILSGWDGKAPFVDPMCGSGTILMEAAAIANSIAPGKMRDFGFASWVDFDEKLWRDLQNEASDAEIITDRKIVGRDRSKKAISIAKNNINNCGFDKYIDLGNCEMEKLDPPRPADDETGIVIMNPPYGERLEEKDIIELYKNIGDNLKKSFAGYNAWIISSNIPALKRVGLKASRRIPLFNGPLECRFYKFELYKGTRKIKKEDRK